VGETGKGCRLAGALGRWRGWLGWTLTLCAPIAWPAVVEHDAQPEQSEEAELVEQKRRYHGEMPSFHPYMRAFYETVAELPGLASPCTRQCCKGLLTAFGVGFTPHIQRKARTDLRWRPHPRDTLLPLAIG